MARRKFNRKLLPAQRLYVVAPNPRDSIVKRRTRLFLENGTEIRNVQSIQQDNEFDEWRASSTGVVTRVFLGRGPVTLVLSKADVRFVKTRPRKK